MVERNPKETVMSYRSLPVRILLALAVGAILAPAAYAKAGVTVRTDAPPPLDAGSALPNPDYSTAISRSSDGFD